VFTFFFMDNSLPSRFSPSEMKRRARVRRDRMVGHRADSFQDADDWDLDFWQKAGAEARLSALVSLRNEVEIIGVAKKGVDGRG